MTFTFFIWFLYLSFHSLVCFQSIQVLISLIILIDSFLLHTPLTILIIQTHFLLSIIIIEPIIPLPFILLTFIFHFPFIFLIIQPFTSLYSKDLIPMIFFQPIVSLLILLIIANDLIS